LPQPPECWDYRLVPPHQTYHFLWNKTQSLSSKVVCYKNVLKRYFRI
jgi:hypothetical protein